MTGEREPILLAPSRVRDAAEMFARAFFEDPFIGVLYPNAERRLHNFAKTTTCLLHYALHYGEVHVVSPQLEGAAVWLPPSHIAPSAVDMIRFRLVLFPFYAGFQGFRRILSYITHGENMRIQCVHGPHWYLQLVGVDPSHHGEGCAAVLLRRMFSRLDRLGMPCCLDTETERNVAIYEHFGFRIANASTVPGTDCPYWLMVRDVGSGRS